MKTDTILVATTITMLLPAPVLPEGTANFTHGVYGIVTGVPGLGSGDRA